MVHEEWWIARNHHDSPPELMEGPFGTHHAAQTALSQYAFAELYVVLVGDFPGKYNDVSL